MSQLCQLADVKTYLGISTSATDVVLAALITNASDFIESFCNRTFAPNSYTETRNGSGTNRLFMREAPVTAVASVTIDGFPVAAATNAVSPGFVFDDLMVYVRPGGFPCLFTKGVQNVVVQYTAGFATTPAAVAQACIELVAHKFGKRDRIDKKNETLGAQQTQGYDMSAMPAQVKLALQPYVRWDFAP